VAAALAARRAEAAAAIHSTPEMVLTALWRIAGKAEEARRYEAAVSALKLLGQHHGLFEDVTPENESARRVLGILERMALRASGGRAALPAGTVVVESEAVPARAAVEAETARTHAREGAGVSLAVAPAVHGAK
jgi:hypothetical protein